MLLSIRWCGIRLALVAMLLALGSAPAVAQLTPDEALVEAASAGHLDSLHALLAAGADASAKDANDQTALALAAAHPPVMALLQAAATQPAGRK